MKKVIHIIKFLIFLILIGILVFINIKIHTSPNLQNQQEVNKDVLLQLNYLEDKIKQEFLAEKMQQTYPEGYFFTHVLYGLTWCELAINSTDSLILKRALMEARFAYQQIDSEKGKSIFSSNLNPAYGIFYCGWRNYLMAKLLACQKVKNKDEVLLFQKNCEQIANAFRSSETPYLESYPNASWPTDAFLAIASLKIHDQLFSAKYDTLISNWIERVRGKLDPETGLVPHSTDPESGNTIEGTRGSSISLILRILAEIDPDFAVEQFKRYYKHFHISVLGFPAIREYPKGKSGPGDIDSGPVIFGIGFSGTIVAIGTLKSFGEYKTANLLSNTIETFGFPFKTGSKKAYLFESLPIADAFIVWSRVAKTNNKITVIKEVDHFSFGSSVRLHIYSFIIILIITLVFYRKKVVALIKK